MGFSIPYSDALVHCLEEIDFLRHLKKLIPEKSFQNNKTNLKKASSIIYI